MNIKTVSVFLLCSVFITTLDPSMGSVVGTAHDFSKQGWSEKKICLPCHTPYNANNAETGAPLWNHAVITTNFTIYDNQTLDVKPESQPHGASRLCLSCHDGSMAPDHFGKTPGSGYIPNAAKLFLDLSRDHPVSIKWRHQNQKLPCSKCHVTQGQTLSSKLPFFNGYIECETCHDVHNSTINAKLLRLPAKTAEICFFCHNK